MFAARHLLCFILLFLTVGIGRSETPRKIPDFDLFVADREMAVVKLFNGKTGKFIRDFSVGNGLNGAQMMAFGPDGNLYVSTESEVQRFDGKTGQFLGTFASGHDLRVCTGLAFGSDGKLYVASAWAQRIKRFDGKTGVYIDDFVPSDNGGPDVIPDMVLGPDGNVYVISTPQGSGRPFIKRYNGKTGAFMGDFAGGNGMNAPRRMTFGPDGNIYVVNELGDSAEIKRFNGKTGAFMDNFVPKGVGELKPYCALAFGPDGNLYVTTSNPTGVKRFDGRTGYYLGDLITGNTCDMKSAANLLFRIVPAATMKRK